MRELAGVVPHGRVVTSTGEVTCLFENGFRKGKAACRRPTLKSANVGDAGATVTVSHLSSSSGSDFLAIFQKAHSPRYPQLHAYHRAGLGWGNNANHASQKSTQAVVGRKNAVDDFGNEHPIRLTAYLSVRLRTIVSVSVGNRYYA